MSWNPFSRLSTSKRTVVTRSAEREFSREVKKLDELEKASRKVYKSSKRLAEARIALAKSEKKVTQDLLGSALCQRETGVRRNVQEWDQAVAKLDHHTHEANAVMQKTLTEPMKKFTGIFPHVQQAVKKREQSLQEYQKCHTKHEKYKDRERTGQNIVKMEQSKKALLLAQEDFNNQNSMLMRDMPRLNEQRSRYFQPSMDAYIRTTITQKTEAYKAYSEVSSTLNDLKKYSTDDYRAKIKKNLKDIKALSITVDD